MSFVTSAMFTPCFCSSVMWMTTSSAIREANSAPQRGLEVKNADFRASPYSPSACSCCCSGAARAVLLLLADALPTMLQKAEGELFGLEKLIEIQAIQGSMRKSEAVFCNPTNTT